MPESYVSSILDLLDLGFIQVGIWDLDPNLKSGIRFSLSVMEGERVIYGFVVGDDLKYIGVCSHGPRGSESRYISTFPIKVSGTKSGSNIGICAISSWNELCGSCLSVP